MFPIITVTKFMIFQNYVFCFLNENATTKKQQDVPNKGYSLFLNYAGNSGNTIYIGMQPLYTGIPASETAVSDAGFSGLTR